jgi:HSP20 family protein
MFNDKLEVMMASNLMRFDPFRSVEDLIRDFSMLPTLRGFETAPRIKMDVSETDKEYLVKADVPGVKKEDIKVAIDGNQITISAESKEEKETNVGGVIRSERYCGQQYRSFTLPQDVDDTKSKASYENGVLQLTLPKKPGTGGKQLSVQ